MRAQFLTGTVVDAYSLKPVEGATVLLVGTLHAAMTGADGSFRLVPRVEADYTLQVTQHGYRTHSSRVTVRSGEEVASVLIQLVPEFREVPLPAPVGQHVWPGAASAPTYKTLDVAPSVQVARRSVAHFVPTIRGLHSGQVLIDADGIRSVPGSPYGPSLLTSLQPSVVELVPGPYAMTWGPGALGALRIRTPLLEGFHSWVGYTGPQNRYDVAAGWGRIGDRYSYELGGVYGVAPSWHSTSEWIPEQEVGVHGLRGRARLRHRHTEATGIVSYQEQTYGAIATLQQTGVAIRMTQRLQGKTIGSVDLGTHWQARNGSGWPYTESPAHRERVTGGYAIVHFRRVRAWQWQAGLDGSGTRLGGAQLAQVGVSLRGARATDRLQYSSAVRADGYFQDGQRGAIYLGGAAAVRVVMGEQWALHAMLGSVTRPPSMYERFAQRTPHVSMPLSTRTNGRETLDPEQIFQGDVAINYEGQRAAAVVSVFWQTHSESDRSAGRKTD